MLIAPSFLEGVITGSFTNAPIRMVDTEYIDSGSVASDIDFRWTAAAPDYYLENKLTDNTTPPCANQPQWYDGVTGGFASTDYGVVCVEIIDSNFSPPGAVYLNGSGQVGVVKRCNTTQFLYCPRPTVVSAVNYIRARVNCVEWANQSNVLASAEYYLEYTRT